MEFKQLEAFVAVVDYGSFSEAARRLYLTQPTISAHIRSLEDELHMKLIIRTTKKTTITAKGYQLYDSAVRMLEIRNNLLENFTGAHKHMIDLALVGQNTRDESCVFIPFCHDELVIATPVTDHYLALKDRETPAVFHDFLKDPILLREKGSGSRRILERNLAARNLKISDFIHYAEVENIHTMVSLLVRDCGIAFLYEAAVEQEIRQGLLKEIRLEDFSMDHEFLFLWNKGSVFSSELKKLCEEWIQLDKDASGGR